MELSSCRKTYVLFLAGVYPEDVPDEEEVLTGVGEQIDFSKLQDEENHESEESDEEGEIPDSELLTAPDSNDDLGPAILNDVTRETRRGPVSEYDEIPRYFVDKKTWIKNTNLLCCNCSNEIEGMPCFVPLNWTKRVFTNETEGQIYVNAEQDEASEVSDAALLSGSQNVKEEKVIQVHLLACDSCCAKRYIKRSQDSKITNVWESLKLLDVVHEKLYGEKPSEIPEAEDPRSQAKFCGKGGLTEDEYRDKNRNKALRLKVALFHDH
jgi:hypothetical protein